MLDIAILEPYCGGSHAAFVETFMRRTRHRCRLASLPARKWKWRMRGAALWFARDDGTWLDSPRPDVVFCNDMLDVAALRALAGPRLAGVPVVCYFHENQLTYPLSPDDRRDYQYGFTNITTCLASDEVWFNSADHRDAFLAAADRLLAKMPDYRPAGVIDDIRRRARVMMPGVDVPEPPHESQDPIGPSPEMRHRSGPPRILWPHRWEYDKNPEPFLAALAELAEVGVAFELVLTGERFRTAPPAFAAYRQAIHSKVVHEGFIADRKAYLDMVASCDVVVSTAIQENFGLAVVEAIALGAWPILPNRLAYPEVIPDSHHAACLYDADGDLPRRLRRTLDDPPNPEARSSLREAILRRFSAAARVAAMDDRFEALVAGQAGSRHE